VGEGEVAPHLFGEALVKGGKCSMLTGTDDQNTRPTGKALALIDEGRTSVNGNVIRDAATARRSAPMAFPAGLLATPGGVQGATQRLVSADALADARD
jgi:hypothetical protein